MNPARRAAPAARLLAVATLTVSLAACGSATNKAAPPARVDGLDGGSLLLAEPDAVTVVAFVASWCAPCRRELPELETRHLAAEPGVRFVAVAVQEEPVATRRLVDETGITFPVGVDPDGIALAGYGFVGLPGTMVLDRNGDIAHRYRGTIDFEDLDRRLDRLAT